MPLHVSRYTWPFTVMARRLYFLMVFRGDIYLGPHLLFPFHWGIKIKLIDVYYHGFFQDGDDAAKEGLGGGNVCCGGAEIPWVVNEVASHCQSCFMCFLFLWPDAHNYYPICHDSSLLGLVSQNEHFCVLPVGICLPTPCDNRPILFVKNFSTLAPCLS